jgi:hypothetical protein
MNRYITLIMIILSGSTAKASQAFFRQAPPGSHLTVALAPRRPAGLKALGTRSWIRLSWQGNSSGVQGYHIYWSASGSKPAIPGARVPSNRTRYYITTVRAGTKYHVWIEAYNTAGSSRAATTSVVTAKSWALDSLEAAHLSIPSSPAVPAGMRLFWQDEFNDALLNRNKWTTGYYSTIDFRNGDNRSALLNDTLPQAGYIMTDSTINIVTNDTLPRKFFSPRTKISSIQTYNWSTDENLLDNSRGGYYEVRVRRNNTPSALDRVNCAYWFDSPGPDLKYYMEQGDTAYGVTGIRPHGQAFEIDVFEENGRQRTTTPFTIHGNVAKDGTFLGHLTTFNGAGDFQNKWVVHGLLWTPRSIKYYINGVLQKQWTGMSPDHFMNVLLGVYGTWTYGSGKSANMEVDYIRGYQWPLVNGNELPNPGFEYDSTPAPWEGSATVSAVAGKSGHYGAVLAPGQSLYQYVYLNNGNKYRLSYWMKGKGSLRVSVENTAAVSGDALNNYQDSASPSAAYTRAKLDFTTASAYRSNMQTVKVTFVNNGPNTITLDDLALVKGGTGGSAMP